MKILSRKVNESILIGSEITVTVTNIKGMTVKLEITAPSSVPVYREEIYQKIKFQEAQGTFSPREVYSKSNSRVGSLKLGRRIGEKIHIADLIMIVVLETGRGGVRLGISAPSDFDVIPQNNAPAIFSIDENEEIKKRKPMIRYKKSRVGMSEFN